MKDTTGLDLQEVSVPKLSYLEKPVLDTMEDFHKFIMFMKRPGVDKKPCVVTPEIFDLISEGQDTPFMDYQNVKVFCSTTKEHADRLLKKHVNMVVI